MSGATSDSIRGVFTALATPFSGGALDLPSLRRLVESQVKGGVAGLSPCGTTGESPTISAEEHRTVVRTVVEAAGRRVLVVAGAGSNDTRHAVALVRSAKAAGADGALAVAPYYNRPPQEGLYRHFRAMADEGGLPLVLYHVPGRTGVQVEVDTIARLWESGGMIGLKEAHGSVERVRRIRDACGIPILSGDDATTVDMIALGAVGVVSVASNVAPAEVVTLTSKALAGDAAGARAVNERLATLVKALFLESNPIPVKAALKMLGVFTSDEVRLPLVPATAPVVEALRVALRGLGLFRS
jgi:4-hydroxy-tetrahydrodipicolinate synthase